MTDAYDDLREGLRKLDAEAEQGQEKGTWAAKGLSKVLIPLFEGFLKNFNVIIDTKKRRVQGLYNLIAQFSSLPPSDNLTEIEKLSDTATKAINDLMAATKEVIEGGKDYSEQEVLALLSQFVTTLSSSMSKLDEKEKEAEKTIGAIKGTLLTQRASSTESNTENH